MERTVLSPCLCKRICRGAKCSCKDNGSSCFEGCTCACSPKAKEAPFAKIKEIPVVQETNLGKRKPIRKRSNPTKKRKLEELEAIVVKSAHDLSECCSPSPTKNINSKPEIKPIPVPMPSSVDDIEDQSESLQFDDSAIEHLNTCDSSMDETITIEESEDFDNNDEISRIPKASSDTSVRNGKAKKRVSFGLNSERIFKRAVSVCSIPSTGSYPLGLSWEVLREEKNVPLASEKEEYVVNQIPEKERLSKLSSSGVSISGKTGRNSRRSRRITGASVLDTTDSEDQTGILNLIRSSRNRIGCECFPKKPKKGRKKRGLSGDLTCCTGKNCACAKNELRCHIGICYCAEFVCKNKFGRRQLKEDEVAMERIRVLQPEIWEEIRAQIEDNNSKLDNIDTTISSTDGAVNSSSINVSPPTNEYSTDS